MSQGNSSTLELEFFKKIAFKFIRKFLMEFELMELEYQEKLEFSKLEYSKSDRSLNISETMIN